MREGAFTARGLVPLSFQGTNSIMRSWKALPERRKRVAMKGADIWDSGDAEQVLTALPTSWSLEQVSCLYRPQFPYLKN